MAAEDLTDGDWTDIKWAGEAQLLQSLETELRDLRMIDEMSLLEPGKAYDLPTSHDCDDAAKILMEFINE